MIRVRVSEVSNGHDTQRYEYVLSEEHWNLIDYMIVHVLPKLREASARPTE